MGNKGQSLSAALSEAEAVIKAAEERAENIINKSEGEFQHARAEAYDKGFQQGQVEATKAAIRLLEDSEAIGEILAKEAARLAIAISSSVIGEQVSIKPDIVQTLAKRALQESIVGESASIVVNPADKDSIEKSYDDLCSIAGSVKLLVEEDDTVSRGGCIVRTEFGEVDARIEMLLDSIASRLGVEPNGKTS